MVPGGWLRTTRWNILTSPRDLLRKQLAGMGARITDHSINRVDFAMDFQTQGFDLRQDQFVAHSHTKP